ncbi:MAG TPA: zf-HC2 domain-containing protein [Pyrinomonadaceae bacterium]|jgi:anti-sigma factor RsiW
MNCEYTEKVSALVDEELDEQEAVTLREHVAACEVCRRAEDEFLLLRREIKSYTGAESPGADRRRALEQIRRSGKVPLWKKRIALPAPALALLILSVLVLGVWMAAARLRQARAPVVEAVREGKKPVVLPAPNTPPESEVDLARFDHGGRAVIYKVRRTDALNAGQ